MVRCIIGLREWERHERQNVILTLTLHADLAAAGENDSFADTVDYVTIKKKVVTLAEASSFYLIEALAERVAQVCLEDPRVQRVDVRLEKPGALRYAQNVAVEITRLRGESEA
jgi:FolB domain-containing protein